MEYIFINYATQHSQLVNKNEHDEDSKILERVTKFSLTRNDIRFRI